MPVNQDAYKSIRAELDSRHISLVAVSKTKPVEDILALYNLGQRDFGENYVQEMVDKAKQLPPDIRWHFIGHLQTNKVKQIAGFVQLIQGVDSLKLLKEVDKQAGKQGRVIDCLLQVHIAQEETKFGLDESELMEILTGNRLDGLQHICVKGLMGMASFSDDMNLVREEFANLKGIFDKAAKFRIQNLKFSILSMGMSGDYKVAIEEGSTMVRIGSIVFGTR